VAAGRLPDLGGLVDVSRTGAKLYVSWKVKIGDMIPLMLSIPDVKTPVDFPSRVVWVRPDRPGLTEAFEARLQLLREYVHLGHAKHDWVYGFLCGVVWDAGVDRTAIRVIQRHFEDSSDRPRKRVFLSSHHTPGKGGNPNLSLRPGY
jgi:hypothetical protein